MARRGSDYPSNPIISMTRALSDLPVLSKHSEREGVHSGLI